MVKTEKNPGGLPKEVFDDLQAQARGQPGQVLIMICRLGRSTVSTVRRDDRAYRLELVAPGNDGRREGALRRHRRFLTTDFTEDLKRSPWPAW